MNVQSLQYRFLKVDEFKKRDLPLPRFYDGVHDHHNNETFGEFICITPDFDWDHKVSKEIYGVITYGIYNNEETIIKMIETNEIYRGLGIAAEMVSQLSLRHKTKIVMSHTTEDGAKLVDFLNANGFEL